MLAGAPSLPTANETTLLCGGDMDGSAGAKGLEVGRNAQSDHQQPIEPGDLGERRSASPAPARELRALDQSEGPRDAEVHAADPGVPPVCAPDDAAPPVASIRDSPPRMEPKCTECDDDNSGAAARAISLPDRPIGHAIAASSAIARAYAVPPVSVGDRIRIFWDGSARWYSATVSKCHVDGRTTVRYDDGEARGTTTTTDGTRPRRRHHHHTRCTRRTCTTSAGQRCRRRPPTRRSRCPSYADCGGATLGEYLGEIIPKEISRRISSWRRSRLYLAQNSAVSRRISRLYLAGARWRGSTAVCATWKRRKVRHLPNMATAFLIWRPPS